MKIDSEITLTISMTGMEAFKILEFVNQYLTDKSSEPIKEFGRQLDLVRKV